MCVIVLKGKSLSGCNISSIMWTITFVIMGCGFTFTVVNYKPSNMITQTVYVPLPPISNNSHPSPFKFPQTTNKDILDSLFNITYPSMANNTPYEIYENVIHPLHETWNKLLNMKGISGGEGYSGQLIEETVFYIKLVLDLLQYKSTYVSNKEDVNILVCEIGFNMGHSALTYLFTDYIGRVQYLGFSYPINNHQLILKTMKDMFKLSNKLTVLWGDSTKYLPYYISVKTKLNQLNQCDIVIVDGGHTKPVPQTDINNMKFLAKIPNHTLIVDDIGCIASWCTDVNAAWIHSIESKLVTQTDCITLSKQRGWCWGSYN